MYPGTFALGSVTLFCALAASVHTGCRSAPEAEIAFASDTATADGLRRVKDTRGYAVYMKPGARLQDYSEVLVDPFMISYKRLAQPDDARQPKRAYVLDAATEDRLRQTLRELFVQELRKSRFFRISDATGPQVARVQCRVSDLVVGPPNGDQSVQELDIGEMTLILDVRDSETAEAIARVGSRFENPRQRKFGLSTKASWHEIQHEVRRWAARLRESLDELHELGAAPSAVTDPPTTARIPADAPDAPAGATRFAR